MRVNGVNSSLIRWETARLSITRNRQKGNRAGAFEKRMLRLLYRAVSDEFVFGTQTSKTFHFTSASMKIILSWNRSTFTRLFNAQHCCLHPQSVWIRMLTYLQIVNRNVNVWFRLLALRFCLIPRSAQIQIKITLAIDPASGIDINFSSLLTLQGDQWEAITTDIGSERIEKKKQGWKSKRWRINHLLLFFCPPVKCCLSLASYRHRDSNRLYLVSKLIRGKKKTPAFMRLNQNELMNCFTRVLDAKEQQGAVFYFFKASFR